MGAFGACLSHNEPGCEDSLLGEPPNLNSTKATDADSFFIIGHTMEGLTRYDQAGNIVPAVAEKWEINDKTATFKIHKDVKWANRKPNHCQGFRFFLENRGRSKNSFGIFIFTLSYKEC